MSHHRLTDDHAPDKPRTTMHDAIEVACARATREGQRMVVYRDARGYWHIRPVGEPAPNWPGVREVARVVPGQAPGAPRSSDARG